MKYPMKNEMSELMWASVGPLPVITIGTDNREVVTTVDVDEMPERDTPLFLSERVTPFTSTSVDNNWLRRRTSAQKELDEEEPGKTAILVDAKTGTIVCEDGVLRRNLRDDYDRFGEPCFREGLVDVFFIAYACWVESHGGGGFDLKVYFISDNADLYDQELYNLLPDYPVSESGIPTPPNVPIDLPEGKEKSLYSIFDDISADEDFCIWGNHKHIGPNIGFTSNRDRFAEYMKVVEVTIQ